MKPRGFLTATAAATVAVAAALAAPGMASAATKAGAVTPVPVVSQPSRVNLHAAFERLSGHVTTGPRAGIVPPRGATGTVRNAGATHPAASRASGQAGTCTEPNCDLTWNGGPVQHSPKVYVVFWGLKWSTNAGEIQSKKYLLDFYQGLGTSSDTWSTITSQYTDGTGGPAFSGSVLQGAVIDTSKLPSKVTPDDLAKEAASAAAHFGITSNTDISNAQVVVASQSGTCFSDGFAGSSCGSQGFQPYCAWHSAMPYGNGYLSFTNLPYLLNAGNLCGENWINPGSNGTRDGFSTVGGHEYAESVTDPVPDTGWIDLNDPSGGEIGDKCAWGYPAPSGDIVLSTGTFAMQSLWDNASGGCQMPLTVTSVSAWRLSGGRKYGKKISVRTGTAVSDQALLSGGNAATATGTVTYDVYSNAACTRRVSASTRRVTAGMVPASAAVKLTKAGTYYWQATYSGDALNAGSASTCGTSGDVEKVTVPPPSIDRVASTRHKTSASVLVSTEGKGELLVAYVAAKGPRHRAQSASVSARGLKWHLVARSDHGRGDAEIWYARATAKLSGLKVTARDRYKGWPAEITVVAYKNAPGVGRHVARHAGRGAPFGSLTTSRASSLVFAIGDNWVKARIVRPVRGQRLVRRMTDSLRDTYWVQATDKATAKAGTKVTIRDTRPTADPYNIVLVEIR